MVARKCEQKKKKKPEGRKNITSAAALVRSSLVAPWAGSGSQP